MRIPRFLLCAALLAACGDDGEDSALSPATGERERDARPGGGSSAPLDAATPLDAAALPSPPQQPPTVDDAPDAAPAALPEPGHAMDAGTPEPAVDAPDAAPACIAEDARCDQGSCCDGSSCVISSEQPYAICAPSCELDQDCDSGCCAALPGAPARVCAPALHCTDEPEPLSILCASPILEAEDGTFLGEATSRPFGDSVCNKSGDYGSLYGSDSIFNKSSDWGAPYASNSAYSTSAIEPPRIVCSSGSHFAEAYVSKSDWPQNAPVIDPDVLCETLALSGH